ncbi:DEAD/DEAH family helicase [Entomoplasma ellychniae]|uniref:DEAD/DEAH family helicase n=1 Tax=Entomoplasma ellychniae TaxID=2114 RepID=A0A8E2U9X7_9MOLU|nr:DEAD/DEAH box helicase family protein [Entomoplasma ellychniae]PPE04604.1 DEAD/DEAH family helicase [Entomoplasma ellychniae]
MKKKLLQDILLKENEIVQNENIQKLKNQSDRWILNQIQNDLGKEIEKFSSIEEKIQYINTILGNKNIFSNYKNQNLANCSINDELSINNLIVSFAKYIEDEFIYSSDVFMISPFISSFMVNKLRNWLSNNEELKVKIITTTFDGSSKFLSLETLVELKKDFRERIDIKIENSFKNNGSRIHMKAYCFLREGGFGNLYIGSNNFTRTGIMLGNEYSIKVSEFREKEIFSNFLSEFNKLWSNNLIDIENTEIINKLISAQIFIDEINRVKEKEQDSVLNNLDMKNNSIQLFPYQQEAINTIIRRENAGINKHLVVMATGTGKTLVVAKYFEHIYHQSNRPLKILFIAHQKEILDQGMETFEKVMPGFKKEVGEFYDQRATIADLKNTQYVFTTFQTCLLNLEELENYAYDLVIFDEVHHIEAASYKKVYDVFSKNCKTLIGLTATPERTEGIDIKKYFNHEYAYKMGLYEALLKDFLAPFDYYFIKDDTVDLTGIDLVKNEKVGKILSSTNRNEFVLENIKKMIGLNNRDTSTVLFCSSIDHAIKLKEYLCNNYLRCEVLTSENSKSEREKILSDFKNKKINYLCVRDIFNEGVDVPNIDRIMFLRPTNSLLIYLQQLGRGLRKTPDKKLQIYDFVNNVDLYVNKKYDPFLLFRAFSKDNNIRVSDLIKNELKVETLLPNGSNIYMEYLTRKDLINKIKKYESNKSFDNIISEFSKIDSFDNYEEMFLENETREDFSPFKIYSKGKSFIKGNEVFSLVLSRMAINNISNILDRWLEITEQENIDVEKIEDRLFIYNFCNNSKRDKELANEKNLKVIWKKVRKDNNFIKELQYLIKFKLKNEDLITIENIFSKPLNIFSLKNMYFTYDQINTVLLTESKEYFKRNTNVKGIYEVAKGDWVICASSLTKQTSFKHSNYFFENTGELSWESPDEWKFSNPEKINLSKNRYFVFYQSEETVNLFNDKIRKFIGTVQSIEKRESMQNNKTNKENKVLYKLKVS